MADHCLPRITPWYVVCREWISPATVAYFVNELTANLTVENDDLVEKLDWYILIVHNPDGYDYTWTTDRGGINGCMSDLIWS